MKLLVTGATGFLGRRVVEYYQKTYQVIAVGHADCELTNMYATEALVAKHKPDVVVHTAAISNTSKCTEDPAGTAKVNVTAAGNVAMACDGYGAKLVFCSSDQVYSGAPQTAPHSESEVLVPNHVYGQQKLAAERLCMALSPEAVCLRLSWLYSTEIFAGERENFLTTYLARLQNRQPLSYPVFDGRGLTDVWEVVKNLERAWALPGGVYNFGSPADGSVCEIACKLAAAEQPPRAVTPDLTAFADVHRDLRMDLSKCAAHGIFFSDTAAGLLAARGHK